MWGRDVRRRKRAGVRNCALAPTMLKRNNGGLNPKPRMLRTNRRRLRRRRASFPSHGRRAMAATAARIARIARVTARRRARRVHVRPRVDARTAFALASVVRPVLQRHTFVVVAGSSRDERGPPTRHRGGEEAGVEIVSRASATRDDDRYRCRRLAAATSSRRRGTTNIRRRPVVPVGRGPLAARSTPSSQNLAVRGARPAAAARART